MSNKPYYFLSVLLAALFYHISSAQDTDPFSYNANIRPSAQAYEMTKYGSLTPSLYTGTFQYSLPIYTYKDEDFDIPVSLDYSFNGYRPSQTSGPVGLGWTLNCGGVITREVIGLPDELNEETLHGFFVLAKSSDYRFSKLKNSLIDGYFTCSDNDSLFYYCGTTPFVSERESNKAFFGNMVLRSSTPIITWTHTEVLLNDLFDSSPDIYHFSFLGYSGSFTISPSGEAVVYDTSFPRGEFKIDLDLRYSGEDSRITITTSDGSEYLFGTDIKYIDYSYESATPDDATRRKYFSALKLKRITAPNGRFVEYDYCGDDSINGLPFLSISYYPEIRQINGRNEIASSYYSGYSKKDARVMKTISRQIRRIFIDEHPVVLFNYSDRPSSEFAVSSYTPEFYGYRGDVSYSLSTFNNSNRLSSIIIKDLGGNILDSISLTQSYTSSSSGHSPKMFLSSVEGNAGLFSFEYSHSSHEDMYPPVDCDATDHWGFWRGSQGKFVFLSSGDIHSQEGSLYTLINGNKNPVTEYTLYGAMTHIHYPMGGQSDIEYEQNVVHKRIDIDLTVSNPTFFIDSCGAYNVGGVRVRKIVNSAIGYGSFRDSTIYVYSTGGILHKMPRYIAALKAQYHYTNYSYLPYIIYNANSYQIIWCNSGLSYSWDNDFLGYSAVTELYSDGSSKVTGFSDYKHYPDIYLPGFNNGSYFKYFLTVAADDAEAPNTMFCVLDATDGTDLLRNEAITGIKLTDRSSFRGRPLLESYYDVNDALLKRNNYVYYQEEVYSFEDLINSYSHCSVGERYYLNFLLDSVVTTDYRSGSPITTTTTYTYNAKGQKVSEQTTSNTLADGYGKRYRYWHEIDSTAPAANICDVASSRLRGNVEYITSLDHFAYNDTLRTLPVRKTSYNILTPYPTQTPFTPQTGDSTVVTMSYNSANHWRPFTVSFPGDTYIQFAWDTSGRYILSREENGSANKTWYQWQDMVGLSHITYPTGQGEYYGYDSKNRLCSIDNTWQEPLVRYDYHLVNGGDTLSGGTNFIRRTSYLRPAISYKDISYYDGLGYPVQDVALDAGSAGHVVTPKWLDPMRRDDSRIYLPYPSDVYTFDASAISSQQNWYQNTFGSGEVYNYQENRYESSPVGKRISSRLPGEAYRSHPDTIVYRVNSTLDSVLAFSYNAGSSSTISVGAAYAPAGTLACTAVTDADGHITETFSDAFGHVLLSRSRGDGDKADTYYVRDMKDSLVCVIQPEGSALISRGTTLSLSPSTMPSALSNYAFIYTYDARGRLTAKKGPSLEAEEYTYDDRDRLVTSTDGNLRDYGWKIKYEYDIYDCLTRKSIVNAATGATVVVLAEYAYDRTGYQCTGANAPPVPTALAFEVVDPGITGVYPPATTDRAGTSLGQKYYEKLLILEGGRYSYGSPKYVERAFYYDNLGRLLQSVESNAQGGITRESFNRDFAGNIVSRHISATAGATTVTKLTAFDLDTRGRVTAEHTYLNGATTPTTSVIFTYDVLGRQNAINDGGLVQADHYALQGWVSHRLSELTAGGNTSSIFSEYLRREGAVYTIPSYTGRIAETFWMHDGQPSGTYSLTYDGFGRLRDGWHYLYGNPVNEWSERNITYDRNGNVLSLLRYGSSGTMPTNNYTISYEGNRALLINGTAWYEYDFNGNVTGDAAREYAIGYNVLNLPSWFNDGQSDLCVFYDYLADGTKVALHREETGLGLAWLGDIVFNLVEPTQGIEDQQSRSTRQSKVSKTANGYMKVLKGANLRNEGPDDPGNGEEEGAYYSFESTPYSGGRIEANGTGLTVRKFVTDHLGSIRAIVSNNTVVERSDYYPFGGKHNDSTLPTLTSNRYGFIGKERQNISTGLDPYIDFGARFYDPLTARWLSPDPLADKYTSLTQYNYCGGDPVNFVDPDGKDFIKKNRLRRVIIEATIYTNEHSELSLDQAIDFWNSRTSDYYKGKRIVYKISKKKEDDDVISKYSNLDYSDKNTYMVDSNADVFLEHPNASGTTTKNKKVFVREEYATTLPDDPNKPSTTGAHELGHVLGMKDSDKGIMSRSQDNNRTSEVTEDNIKQLMKSRAGTSDFLSKIIQLYEKITK